MRPASSSTLAPCSSTCSAARWTALAACSAARWTPADTATGESAPTAAAVAACLKTLSPSLWMSPHFPQPPCCPALQVLLLQATRGAPLLHLRLLRHGPGPPLLVRSLLLCCCGYTCCMPFITHLLLLSLPVAAPPPCPPPRYLSNCCGAANLRHFLLFLTYVVLGASYGLLMGAAMGWKDRRVLAAHTRRVLQASTRGEVRAAVQRGLPCLHRPHSSPCLPPAGRPRLAPRAPSAGLQPLLAAVGAALARLLGVLHCR